MLGSICLHMLISLKQQDGKLLVAALPDTNLSNTSFTMVYVS